jgi:hypothetical protein
MEAGLFSSLELEIGIICACLPSFQVLFKSTLSTISGFIHGSMRTFEKFLMHKDGLGKGKVAPSGIRLTTTIWQTETPMESCKNDMSRSQGYMNLEACVKTF